MHPQQQGLDGFLKEENKEEVKKENKEGWKEGTKERKGKGSHQIKKVRKKDNKDGNNESKKKTIPVTGREDLQVCEMLRIPHCIDNRLTVNCEMLATCSSTYSPVRTSQEAHPVSIK
jgi:hypothetical protein